MTSDTAKNFSDADPCANPEGVTDNYPKINDPAPLSQDYVDVRQTNVSRAVRRRLISVWKANILRLRRLLAQSQFVRRDCIIVY
jgi:hypothetical protein